MLLLPQTEGYSQSQNNIGSMEQPSSQRSLNKEPWILDEKNLTCWVTPPKTTILAKIFQTSCSFSVK